VRLGRTLRDWSSQVSENFIFAELFEIVVLMEFGSCWGISEETMTELMSKLSLIYAVSLVGNSSVIDGLILAEFPF
jgi:hypothetical protein